MALGFIGTVWSGVTSGDLPILRHLVQSINNLVAPSVANVNASITMAGLSIGAVDTRGAFVFTSTAALGVGIKLFDVVFATPFAAVPYIYLQASDQITAADFVVGNRSILGFSVYSATALPTGTTYGGSYLAVG